MADITKPAGILVIGVGGMGLAIAKRIGAGRMLILADFSDTGLDSAAKKMEDDGHDIRTHKVDVSDVDSVGRLATDVANEARIEVVVHTAGLSPTMASSQRIYDVDLLGTAIVIDAFADVIAPGGSMVCIASMAGHALHGKLPAEVEEHLGGAILDKLLSHPVFKMGDGNPGAAYSLSKRGNQLRVQTAARRYGLRGCRINSVSPGIIHTPMLKLEMEAPHGKVMKEMVKDSATRRYGTPSDIAAAVAFLTGPDASFITGTDLLVDGGSTASQRWTSHLSEVKSKDEV